MKHQPERTCIGCKKVLHKEDVVRIIAAPDGLIIDYREKVNGRAAYVCPKPECINRALTKEVLGRSLRLKLRPPAKEDFFAMLTTCITERIKSLLAISLKAGKLAAGYSAVQDALEKGRVELLLCARDLSEGTREKITKPESTSIRYVTLFTREELGSILSRDLVGAIAILDKGLADALWIETQRLKGLIIPSE